MKHILETILECRLRSQQNSHNFMLWEFGTMSCAGFQTKSLKVQTQNNISDLESSGIAKGKGIYGKSRQSCLAFLKGSSRSNFRTKGLPPPPHETRTKPGVYQAKQPGFRHVSLRCISWNQQTATAKSCQPVPVIRKIEHAELWRIHIDSHASWVLWYLSTCNYTLRCNFFEIAAAMPPSFFAAPFSFSCRS